jgi:hypothetical protein
MQRLPYMKTLITALAITAVAATSAVAKTKRTKEVRVQHNNSLSDNAVSRSPTPDQFILSLDHGETDPDPRIRFQLARDCWELEFDHAE